MAKYKARFIAALNISKLLKLPETHPVISPSNRQSLKEILWLASLVREINPSEIDVYPTTVTTLTPSRWLPTSKLFDWL